MTMITTVVLVVVPVAAALWATELERGHRGLFLLLRILLILLLLLPR